MTREEIMACRDEALTKVIVPPDIINLMVDLREDVQVWTYWGIMII